MDADDDALVAGLLCFAWEKLSATRRSFRFSSLTQHFVLEGLWFGDVANLIVQVEGSTDSSWLAAIRSATDAEASGLTDEVAAATAVQLRRQPVGHIEEGDKSALVRLCVS